MSDNQAKGLDNYTKADKNKYMHSKVALVKIYAGHPQMHNLTANHSIHLNGRDVIVSQQVWNMAYKLMTYHFPTADTTRPSEVGVSYHCNDVTVFTDIAQLTAYYEYIKAST